MRVQIHLRAEKLGNIARGRWLGRRSNPYATVYVAGRAGEPGADASGRIEVGRTEVLCGDLSPRWTELFIIDYDPTVAWTALLVVIRDCRGYSSKGSDTPMRNSGVRILDTFSITHAAGMYAPDDPVMGEATVECGNVLEKPGQEVGAALEHGGHLYVHVTESAHPRHLPPGLDPVPGVFHCRIRGLDLENIEKGLLGLGAIDPYFELSRKYLDPRQGAPRWVPVYRSGHVPDIINPYWEPFRIDMEKLCHGNPTAPLKVSVWDHEDGKSDRWLGECETDVEELQRRVSRRGNACRDGALVVVGKDGMEIGLIVVLKADIEP